MGVNDSNLISVWFDHRLILISNFEILMVSKKALKALIWYEKSIKEGQNEFEAIWYPHHVVSEGNSVFYQIKSTSTFRLNVKCFFISSHYYTTLTRKEKY